MVFSSAIFLFVFLPLVFLLIRLPRRSIRLQNLLLALASLVFYAFGQLQYLPLFLVSVLINFVSGTLLSGRFARSRAVLAVSVVLNLGILGVFKYTDFILRNLNAALGSSFPMTGIVLPIGISFFTFQGLSYVIDTYRDPEAGTREFLKLLLYISFFPQLIAGPIVKYHDVEMQIQDREVTAEEVKNGVFRFAAGLGKKVIIANGLAAAVDALYALDPGTLGIGPAWFMITAYAFQLVFDFSAYSDMAIGLGKMFGFRFPENFNYPYISRSVREYWKRNHISLSTWFREYLYFPLGGSRKGEGRAVLNLLIVFLATGIWHGAGWTFPVWGLYQALFIILEREHIINSEKWPRLLATLYTDLTIWVGLVLFRAETFAQAWGVWKAMIGISRTGGETTRIMTEMVGPYRILLLILAAFFATPIFRNAVRRWRESARRRNTILLADGILMAGTLALTLLCLLQLASDSYNPFIYYRF